MERRTSPAFGKSLRWVVCVSTLAALGSSASASGVFNPDEEYPVSRFGRSDTRWVADQEDSTEDESTPDRSPASAPAAGSNDRITHRASNAVTAPVGSTRRNGVQEIALIAGDLGFFPRTVFVTRDIPVRMFVTGASKNSLCILMDSFQVRKQVKSQKIEEVSFTPTQPGKFRFYCPINGAEGFMVVREFERADGG